MTTRPAPLPAPHRAPWPRWLPTAAGVVLTLVTTFGPSELSRSGWTTVPSVLVIAGCVAAIVLRRRFPRSAALAAVALAALGILIDAPIVTVMLTVLITLFSAAAHTGRRVTIVLALVAALVLSVTAWFFLFGQWNDARTVIQVVGLIGFAAAAGDATRSRREFIATITERARRAEETKEAEAQRRVAEERLRIARDLHDVMAHQIAVINLHASVAAQALHDRPDDAERSLATVREAARTVLSEIGSLLTVLRAGDVGAASVGSSATSSPVPGLGELDTLLEEFERSGLQVEVRSSGSLSDISPPVDIVAYRVVQEALTNAQKHGSDGSALLHLERRAEGLEIIVVNSVASGTHSTTGDGNGHGLIGVRERVASVGGRLETTIRPGPVHRFTVWLPIEPEGPAR
ncbi:sensor histidine kinase [Herbiconiux ginsengi]|uniref:histidine kinase n=1 Tax=Herbiconiux ginsengi TaxID=381665 RepID=A0A1H3NAF0_9MICO|nr:histidine kinase [Herbiconiux ginsengi]SDY85179.1 Signal transduction histidine kinase [Herbiconiux ginsengi]